MIALLIAAALGHATAQPASTGPVVSISAAGGQLRASQIAVVPTDHDAVIATMPEGAAEVAMSEATRLGLIRNRFPGARYRLRHDGPVRIVREVAAADATAECAAARASVAVGAYLAAEDLRSVPCQREATGGWLGYDVAARSYFARRPIPVGTYLGRIAAGASPSAAAGAGLVYRTSEGPVTVEREVVAVQSARAGRPVFVRTEEGKVLSATLADAEEAE
jgi:hypothetical protein